jgi:hypothetical protein
LEACLAFCLKLCLWPACLPVSHVHAVSRALFLSASLSRALSLSLSLRTLSLSRARAVCCVLCECARVCRCVSNVCQCVVGCLRCDHEWTRVCGVACVFRSHPISRWGYRSIVTPWQRIRLLSASHHARSFFLSYFFFGQFGGYRVAPWPRDHGASAQTHRRGVSARLCDVPVLRVEVIPRIHACCLAHDVCVLGIKAVPLRRRFCVTRPDAVLLTQARVFAIARRGSTARSATAPATARSLR